MRIIGNEQKNNGQDFWEILERIIGKISSIIGAGLTAFNLLYNQVLRIIKIAVKSDVKTGRI